MAAIDQVEKRDGFIAFILIGWYAVLNFLILRCIPINESYIYYQIAVQSAWLTVIAVLVFIRKQSLHSLGFCKEALPLVALSVFSVYVLAFAVWENNYTLVGRWLFYLVAVAGIEDILFHGFAYPRLAKLFHSRLAAVVVVGMLFGAMHHIRPMALDNATWHGVFNWLGSGVVYSFVFLTVYGMTGNIINTILLHAAFDFAQYMPISIWFGVGYIILLMLNWRVKRLK